MSSMRTVTIPNVELTLDQLLTAIRQLEPAARSEVAKALMETEMDARMAELIKSMSSRPSADDITDADVVAEVNAARVWIGCWRECEPAGAARPLRHSGPGMGHGKWAGRDLALCGSGSARIREIPTQARVRPRHRGSLALRLTRRANRARLKADQG